MSNDNNHAERAHALLGGSGAKRWTECPGSVFLLKDMGPSESSVHSIEGTKAHELCEKVLERSLEHALTGEGPVAVEFPDHPQEMVAHAAEYVQTIWDKVLGNSITGKAYGIEELLTLDSHLDMWGSCDFWCIYIDERGKRVGVIVDFKYGFNPVEADSNPQLAFYSCALREEVQRGGKDLDYVRAVIYQPRCFDKEPYDETTFTASQLETWKKKFYRAAEQIFVKRKPKFKAGSWCTFCDAKGKCKTYERDIQSKTSLKLVDTDPKRLPDAEQLSDEQLGRIVLASDEIMDFVKSARAIAIDRFKRGRPVPGTKCVHGVAKRKWREDQEGILGRLREEYGYDATDVGIKGITEVEKGLAKLFDKAQARAILDQFTEKSAPSISLVPESDERPAIGADVELLSNE